MTPAQRRRLDTRRVSLVDREFEATAVRRSLGGRSYVVEAVRDDERAFVRALDQPTAAAAMARCLNQARAFLNLAWWIADNAPEWTQLDLDARHGAPT